MLNESEKRLLSVDGFIEAVENKLPETQSFKRAWEQTEEEYKDLIGHYRYSTYENFRVSKSRNKKQRRHRRLI